jgi:hypothetical protein
MRLAAARIALACLALGVAGAVAAEDALDWAAPLAGDWTLGGVWDGDPYCRLTLGAEGAIGGAGLDVSATCLRNFPLEEAAAWTLRDDAVVLIDALRKPVMVLEPLDDDFYGADLADGRQVGLSRGAPETPESLAALMDGTFTLSGPDNAEPCGFMVGAASSSGGEIAQDGACPEAWKTKAWAGWRAEGDTLVLLDAAGAAILVMTLADGFTFIAEGPDGPLYFGPGVIFAE